MKTPRIKYKWGSEKFYRFYEPLAFRYADLVQADFLPAPNHPLVTRTNKKIFSTVEYDNYILLQGNSLQKHRRKYLSVGGTYSINTNEYYVMIDPVNPVINQSPQDQDNNLLIPYSYPPYKAYQFTDGKIYKATLQNINLVIEPANDDIGYYIYGIRGFFMRGSSELREDSYFPEAVMATMTYAYYNPKTEEEGITINLMLTYSAPPASAGISPMIISSFENSIKKSQQLYEELLIGTPYEKSPGTFFCILQAYSRVIEGTQYAAIVRVPTNKNSISFKGNNINFSLYTSENRPYMRLMPCNYANNTVGIYHDMLSGAPTTFSGEKISNNATPNLELFKPKEATLGELWANTEQHEVERSSFSGEITIDEIVCPEWDKVFT